MLARCTWQRYDHDFGKDGFILSYAENGEDEDGQIDVQVKSTDHIERYRRSDGLFFDVEKRHLESWFKKFIPLALVVYDAQQDKAYYLEIGDCFKKSGRKLEEINKFVRVYISDKDLFTPEAVLHLRKVKNQYL